MRKFALALLALLFFTACHKKQQNGIGSCPNFTTITKSLLPVLGDNVSLRGMLFLTFTDPTEWTSYNVYGKLRDIYGSENDSPKDLYKILGLTSDIQSTIDEINTVYWITDDGKTYNYCTDAGKEFIPIPWYTAEGQKPFFDFGWDKDGPNYYSCMFGKDNGRVYYSEIDQSANCSGGKTYHFMKGINFVRQNSDSLTERGPTYQISQLVRIYYDNCKNELHFMSAQTLKYLTGIEFRSRVEFKGAKDFNFSARAIKVSTGQSGADPKYFTTEAFGDTTTNKKFIMSYKDYSGVTDTVVTSKLFCLAEGSTPYQYTALAGTECAAHETSFSEIPALTYSQSPAKGFEGK